MKKERKGLRKHCKWLKGRNIECPVCGCDTEGDDDVEFLAYVTGGGYDRIYLDCNKCNSKFEFKAGMVTRIKCTDIKIGILVERVLSFVYL